ncbi:uncharacterized protein [Cicer arietinum]|uniref:uncharacterized protein n=1 Tax=Cicer arietinum TaxID=3827 RepID=UPI003CC69AF2
MINCQARVKVNYATYLLLGDAEYWWRNIRFLMGSAQKEVNWESFKRKFLDKYFPMSIRTKLCDDFLKLYQGNMTVSKYAAKFESLSRHFRFFCDEKPGHIARDCRAPKVEQIVKATSATRPTARRRVYCVGVEAGNPSSNLIQRDYEIAGSNKLGVSLREGTHEFLSLANVGEKIDVNIEDVMLVKEYPNIFSTEIPRLPPARVKVNYATYLLLGDAEYWWRNIRFLMGSAQKEVNWESFKRKFLDKYFPMSIRTKLCDDFLKLYQGNMTVSKYAAKFESLSRHFRFFCDEKPGHIARDCRAPKVEQIVKATSATRPTARRRVYCVGVEAGNPSSNLIQRDYEIAGSNKLGVSLREGTHEFLSLANVGEKIDVNIEDVMLVKEYPNIFSTEIPRLPPPQTVIDIRSLVGLAGYYMRFIEGSVKIVAPLTQLTRKHQPFAWTEKFEMWSDATQESCSLRLKTIEYS